MDLSPQGPGEGSTIGPYVLGEVIGRGTSGTTFRARHTALGREVAIKLLNSELTHRGNSSERFKREARILATLDHPNILGIHDCGEHQGKLYMVLELVDGETVRDLLERRAQVPVSTCLRILQETLRGLARAHEKGIIHRDIKPDNLLMTRTGEIKIADFGVGRASDDNPITQVGAVVGTPYYMAPEQCAIPGWTTEVDARSDLYAAGALFYELLTGELPFRSRTLLELAQKKVSEPPPDPRARRPEVPALFAQVIRRLMAARITERYASAEEVLAELAGAPEEEHTEARVVTDFQATKRLPRERLAAREPLAAPDRPRPAPVPAADAPRGRSPAGAIRVTLVGARASYTLDLEPGEPQSLGRSSQRAHLAIPDERLSRLHCELRASTSGEVWIRDLGSSNGTYVNDRRIPGETVLSRGDRLLIGDTELLVELPPATSGSDQGTLTCSRCGEPVRPGSIVDGRAVVLQDQALVVCARCALNAPVEERLRAEGFVVEELIELEGATLVYRARRSSVDEIVTLRVLDLEGSQNPELGEHFRRDARALARLRHPCSVFVYDVRKAPSVLYVVQEHVVGEHLHERVQRRGRLPVVEALQVFFSVARVCELGESQGLLHRNLSPKSIMVTADGETKVTSFALGGAPSSEQLAGEPLRFAAPELLRPGGSSDPARSDIYSFGASLLYALTGHPPHYALSDEDYLKEVRRRMLSSHVVVLEGDTAQLQHVRGFLARCLEIDPAARFASMAELARELELAVRQDFLPGFSGSADTLFAFLGADVSGTTTSRLVRHKRPKGVVAGTFEGDELAEFLQMVGLNQRTGQLEIVWEGGRCQVYLERGAIVGGSSDQATGLAAAREALRAREGSFEFQPELPEHGRQVPPVPVASFLLDVLREADEQAR